MRKRISVLVAGLVLTLAFNSVASAGTFAITFSDAGRLPGATVNDGKYYGTQGAAFDTYTKKDLYVITLSKLNAGNAKITRMSYADGTFKQVKSVIYKNKSVDHANDATIFVYKKVKYLMIAKGGNGNKTACVIKLSDFNNGKAKTYKVNFKKLDNKSGKDLRGVSYVGVKKVTIKKTKTVKKGKKKVEKTIKKKVNRHVFLVEAGRRINKMYLSGMKSNMPTLVKIDSQRVQAPKHDGREGTANGIIYHNGNIFALYGEEGAGGQNRTVMIEKIGMNALFKIKNSNTAKKFPLSWKKTFDQKMFTPESLFFTTLNGKGEIFMTCNGEGYDSAAYDPNHWDYIYKSTQQF